MQRSRVGADGNDGSDADNDDGNGGPGGSGRYNGSYHCDSLKKKQKCDFCS